MVIDAERTKTFHCSSTEKSMFLNCFCRRYLLLGYFYFYFQSFNHCGHNTFSGQWFYIPLNGCLTLYRPTSLKNKKHSLSLILHSESVLSLLCPTAFHCFFSAQTKGKKNVFIAESSLNERPGRSSENGRDMQFPHIC